MEHRATPEVNPGKRLSRLEARREKLLVIIERAQRRFEKHDKASRRTLKDLANYERTRRRLDKTIAKAKAEVADALIEPAIPAPDIGKLYADASDAAAAKRPKRKTRPKPIEQSIRDYGEAAQAKADAAISTDDPDLVEKVGAALEAGREQRMKALGFRKTKSRST